MRFLKADRIFDGKKFLPGDKVLVIDKKNLLKEIIPEVTVGKGKIEHFEGIITPGFVNAHCHLELSHLKNVVPKHTGLPFFAKHIVTTRSKFSKEQITEKLETANTEMWRNGIVAVGDISNSDDSFKGKAGSLIYYHTFIELLGLNPQTSKAAFENGLTLLQKLKKYNLSGSFAAHAAYSTSNELIKLIAGYDKKNKQPFCIHNQESEEETKFFEGKTNGFDDLYRFLNLDISWFKAPKTSSLNNYVKLLPRGSILIHNTCSKAKDLEAANSKNVFWCFCPGANKYIENRLPDFSLFSSVKNKICIGTDSLASNSQLNLISEANRILKTTNEFNLENILRALTSNGASALGISNKFGQFIKGENTGLNQLRFKNSQLQFIKKIS